MEGVTARIQGAVANDESERTTELETMRGAKPIITGVVGQARFVIEEGGEGEEGGAGGGGVETFSLAAMQGEKNT